MLTRVATDNPRRLIRAIAVMEATGRSLAAWQAETPPPPVGRFRAVWLQRPRAELHRRLAARLAAMFAAGWCGEVDALVGRHGAERVAAFPGIGYRQIAAAREHERVSGAVADWDGVREDILAATRQYAKRQLTWFRREPTLEPVILPGTATVPPALDSF